MTTDDSATRTAERPRGWSVVEAVALLGLIAVTILGYRDFVDLHPTDEVAYQRAGRALFEGDASLGALAWAPVFSFFYGVLDLLWSNEWGFLQDAVHLGTRIAAVFSAWWAVRGILSPGAAFLAAAWWSCSIPFVVTTVHPICNVYLFTAVLHFLAVGCFARRRIVCGLVMLLLAVLNRAELAPWLITFALVLALRRGSWGGHGSRRVFVLAVAALACAVPVFHWVAPAAQARSWMVFSQHYASGWAERHKSFERAPMEYNQEITGASFPSATSVGGALIENPSESLAHLWHNVTLLPAVVRGALFSPMVHMETVGVVLVIMLLFLAILGLGRPPPRDEVRDVELEWALRLSLLTLPIMLLVRSRMDLLLPNVIVVTVILGRLATRGLIRVKLKIPGTAPAMLVLAGVAVMPRLFPVDRADVLPIREAVSVLAAQTAAQTTSESRLYASFSHQLLFLSGRPSAGVELRAGRSESGPASARPGDVLLLTRYDVILHGAGLASWMATVGGGDWRLDHGGLGVWVFRRRAK
jgi:hypothetical protein